MSEQVTLLTLFAALPPTIAALASVIIAVVNLLKLNQIHFLVNANLDDVKAELRAANTTIKELTATLQLLKEEEIAKKIGGTT